MILWQLFITFALIGCFSFGGGYGMIPLIQDAVVTQKAWLTTNEFLNILAISESTPGPLAINTATYVGFKIAGVGGAAISTFGLILPAFFIVIAFASIAAKYKDRALMQNAFWGMRPVVVALIAAAGLTLGWQTLASPLLLLAAAAALALLLFTRLHPVLLVVLYGLGGIIIGLIK